MQDFGTSRWSLLLGLVRRLFGKKPRRQGSIYPLR